MANFDEQLSRMHYLMGYKMPVVESKSGVEHSVVAADGKRYGIIKEGTKLLLHACCAPCSSAVLERLGNLFKITIFFYNPNIDTLDEYKADIKAKLEKKNEKAAENAVEEQIINALVEKCDKIIIGGAMAYTFLKALGKPVGKSRYEADQLDFALKCVEIAKEKNKLVQKIYAYPFKKMEQFKIENNISGGEDYGNRFGKIESATKECST